MNKLGRPHIPDATYQVPRSSAFWFWRRRFLKGFYHIWAWRPSWSCDQEHFNKLSFPHPKESPYEISIQLAQWFQRRRCLKMLTDGRTTDAGVTGILIAHLGAFGSGELIKFRGNRLQISVHNFKLFFLYISPKTYVVGTQKNNLNETVPIKVFPGYK